MSEGLDSCLSVGQTGGVKLFCCWNSFEVTVEGSLATSRPSSGFPSKGIVLFLLLFPCPTGVRVEGIWDSVKGLLVGLML